ncbi:DeoR/GlpR family DNA-binding transcription regulator [Schaalia suimastitidis]|uniref:DeoR/GlpR family DNA-binding transcription regulator n=1 Tax=Schaalia suimastitidis TaxID=121163 RepID=UPI000421525E|nr:DeoR/GlpR family DNA-binding transcription regulator [Schaalia suimastitidis]
MHRHERLTALFEYITDHTSVTVDELVAEMGVSAATIRRDLDQLASQQLIVRTHGGATCSPTSSDLPIRYKTGAGNGKEKRLIAFAAANLVSAGEIIGLSGGTTTTEVAREIALREDLSPSPAEPITILTNAVNIANELAVRTHIRVVLTGGVVRPLSFELTGPLAKPVLQGLSIDTLFLGVNAINQRGTYTHDDSEADINGVMVDQAERVIVVADHAKLGDRAFARICGLDKIDTLVTGENADPEIVRQIKQAGVDVILV